MCALSETKLKWKEREVMFGEVVGRASGMEEGRWKWWPYY